MLKSTQFSSDQRIRVQIPGPTLEGSQPAVITLLPSLPSLPLGVSVPSAGLSLSLTHTLSYTHNFKGFSVSKYICHLFSVHVSKGISREVCLSLCHQLCC